MRKIVVMASGLFSLVLLASACDGPPPRPSDEKVVPDVYMTAYTWFDNTPARSPDISHPVLHHEAGGTGTYEDPITVAVGHSLETGKDVLDVPAGTRIYVPNVRRYFIVEDTCGDGPTPEDRPCHSGAEKYDGASIWIDLWIGGEGGSKASARRCTRKVTGTRTAVFNPRADYAVASGEGVIHNGKCDTGYGDGLATR
ncbi:3D (Asp-Asp-Asp) domain-containing protein [Arthrobacter globiformis]|nr:3D (Asp-Asp-Asp) domain-containing protein [Arthrobacter globiformis]